jgi:hypothetical protein
MRPRGSPRGQVLPDLRTARDPFCEDLEFGRPTFWRDPDDVWINLEIRDDSEDKAEESEHFEVMEVES